MRLCFLGPAERRLRESRAILHGGGDGHARFRHGPLSGRRPGGSPGGERFEPIEVLVDTGATYMWIPRDVLEALGVVPDEDWPFVLADGREVRYPVAWIQLRIGARTQPTIGVFGEPGSEPILGVFALEGFRLAADPVNRRLVSVLGLLKAAGGARRGPGD